MTAGENTKKDNRTKAQVRSMEDQENGLRRLFHLALRKLKGYAYWDKTALYLVDRLVRYETGEATKDPGKLNATVITALLGEQAAWEKIRDVLLKTVGILCYPKKVAHTTGEAKGAKGRVICGLEEDKVRVTASQYFMDMHPVGQILGVFWAMTIGGALDAADGSGPVMYQHSYGNRLRTRLFVRSPERIRISDSPHFMEPYFSQYENWRDQALKRAQTCVRDKQDVIVATLDIRRFFYCVDINKARYDEILEEYRDHELITALCDRYAIEERTLRRLHEFVYRVMERFSEKLIKEMDDAKEDGAIPIRKRQVMLPIGFMPSLILSNWVMMPFDDAIVSRVNPVYYGRYVDDIILVDKVKRNSVLYRKIREGEDAADVCLRLFKGILKRSEPLGSDQNQDQTEQRDSDSEDKNLYIDEEVLTNTTSATSLCIQADKLKCFYFEGGKPATLLDCFQSRIAKNASAFQVLPELDDALLDNDYSDVMSLMAEGSPNKLREVEGVGLDRYATSKFLGKLYKIVHAQKPDKQIKQVMRDLSVLLRPRDLVELYTLWERLLEIALLAGCHDTYVEFAHNMYTGIEKIEGHTSLRQNMQQFLGIAIIRTSSLIWGSRAKDLLSAVEKSFDSKNEVFALFRARENPRLQYIATAMTGRYTTPLPIWCADKDLLTQTKEEICLFTLGGIKAAINWDKVKKALTGDDFRVYLEECLKLCDALPYVLSPGEIAYMYATFCMVCGESLDTKKSNDFVGMCYAAINSMSKQETKKRKVDPKATIPMVTVTPFPRSKGCKNTTEDAVIVKIDSASTPKYLSPLKPRIALANIRLSTETARIAMQGRADLSYGRFRRFRNLIAQAQKERVDILVLPEYALPYMWVPDIIRLCAKSQMAIITGIEPIPMGSALTPGRGERRPTIYNLTAVILPYTLEDGSRFAHLTFHHKVHYAPGEIEMIAKNHCTYTCGDTHHLFLWRDVWFSVFCCFELASITDRAAFGHIPDMTVAVEWNPDLEYFSNIMESLSRDIHCYCIQVNNSEYGDNRIVTPMGRVKRDPVRIKGGRNATVITHDLDVELLRECQMDKAKADSKGFKPSPPGFDENIARMKRNGTLYHRLMQDLQPEASPTSSESEEGKATSKA